MGYICPYAALVAYTLKLSLLLKLALTRRYLKAHLITYIVC